MDRANYTCNRTPQGAEYVVNSAPLSYGLLILEIPIKIFGGLFAGLFFGMIAFFLFHFMGFDLVAVGVGLMVFLAMQFGMFRYIKHMLGARGTFRFSIRPDGIAIERAAITNIPSLITRQSFRRLRPGNTADQMVASMGNMQVVSNSAFDAQMWAKYHQQMVGRKQRILNQCCSILIDYDNYSATLADGLDEMTAQNIVEDMLNDLRA